MKQLLHEAISGALKSACADGSLISETLPGIILEKPANPDHGDFACTIAMLMAKGERKAPRQIAEIIVNHLQADDGLFRKIEIAGPGFINFTFSSGAWQKTLEKVENLGDSFGRSSVGEGKKVQVEFVSANPTGPLHIGHGRGAATGDAVASILAAAGFAVTREYYINDAGNQMNTLGRSVYLRYLEHFGKVVDFPGDCYQGDYIRDIAKDLAGEVGDKYLNLSEEEAVPFFAKRGGDVILHGIDDDLRAFGVAFDNWYSEQSLFDRGLVEKALEEMRRLDLVYEHEGALWFRTTRFGDDKDRVVVRANGVTTYFASDIAYHLEKYQRGYDFVVDVWGADHHGYVPRLKGVVEGIGRNRDDLRILLVQLVALLRDGVPVAMSTRSGEFVTLREVVDEVGRDAARFFFLMRRSDSQLDFDLELAKRQSADNPVYYVQYAHARICSIFENARDKGLKVPEVAEASTGRLENADEVALMKTIAAFPETVESSALALEPHRITYYLQDLAGQFHSFYNRNRVILEDVELSEARLFLLKCVRQTLRNGLVLLGLSAPEKM